MNQKEIEKHIRDNKRKTKTIVDTYKSKNKTGHKTKGLSKKTSLLLIEFINLYPLKDAQINFLLLKKTDDNTLKSWCKNSFKDKDPKRILVLIDQKAKWGKIVWGETINNCIKEDKRHQIERTFTKHLNKNNILKGAEKLILEIQNNLPDA